MTNIRHEIWQVRKGIHYSVISPSDLTAGILYHAIEFVIAGEVDEAVRTYDT